MSRMERNLVAEAPYLPAPNTTAEDLMRSVFKESPKAPKRRSGRLWLWGVVPILAGIVVYAVNGALAPLRYDEDRIARMAEVLASGGTYHVATLDIDFAALRTLQIAALTKAPDIMVIGGSPWQSVHQEMGWNAAFVNGFQPGLSVAALEKTVADLRHADRLPSVMVLSVGPGLFRPPAGEKSDVLARLSPVSFVTGLSDLMEAQGDTGASMQPMSASNWVLLPDGSIMPPQDVEALSAEMLALSAAERLSQTGLWIDTDQADALGALITELQGAGIDVHLAIPPYHPTYWDAIQGSPRHEALQHLRGVVDATAEQQGIQVMGGFDPARLGCTAEMFRDARRAGPDCLGKVIATAAETARN